MKHFEDYYSLLGRDYFFDNSTKMISLYTSALNSDSLYVKMVANDFFIPFYCRFSHYLKDINEFFSRAVYSHHQNVILKGLSNFVSLLANKDIVISKEIAEEIMIMIVVVIML